MLKIYDNAILNKHANDYFLRLFNIKNDEIELNGYKSALMNIFPEHLVLDELSKCKRVYNQIYTWIVDNSLHKDFKPIHEYALYSILEEQLECELTKSNNKVKVFELESIRNNLSEEEIVYMDNINNASFYLNIIFEDNDFLQYDEYYDTFGSDLFYMTGYDDRIIELLPKEKREVLKEKMKK
jgi:hypothetical protein